MAHMWFFAQFTTLFAGICSYPLDTVRKRLAMQAGRSKDEIHYRNSLDCCRKILAEEGASGFYKGLGVSLVKGIGASTGLIIYDLLERKFNK